MMFRENLLPKDGSLLLEEGFYGLQESQQLFELLEQEIAWETRKIKLFGKVHDVPRLSAWYGDPGKSYTYSGIRMEPQPWTDSLKAIKARVEAFAGRPFNSLLLNLYRNGTDYVAWHADDEKELGENPVIASLSLGETRRFQLRHKSDKDIVSLELGSGSLVLMAGTIQTHWMHRIAPTKKLLGPRINLTFRQII
jgi:alkylated DNA repair dioxygenase AlkB